jgi:hypothetical protein
VGRPGDPLNCATTDANYAGRLQDARALGQFVTDALLNLAVCVLPKQRASRSPISDVGIGLFPNVALYDVVAAAHLVTAPDHPFGKRAGIPA